MLRLWGECRCELKRQTHGAQVQTNDSVGTLYHSIAPELVS